MPVAPVVPAFSPQPKGRADLVAGALYAVGGGDGYIYYGQVCANKQVGFFRFRSEKVVASAALASEIMSRVFIALPSIGRALRSGHWQALGRHPLKPELDSEPTVVQWPVGTTIVTLMKGSEVLGDTDVADPKIQDLEVIAVYDAIFHVPERLRADFLMQSDAWKVGGSVRRQRLKKEDAASRFPDQPWHRLPPNWVSTRDG